VAPTVAPPAAVAAAADEAEPPSLTAVPTVAPPAAVAAAVDVAEPPSLTAQLHVCSVCYRLFVDVYSF